MDHSKYNLERYHRWRLEYLEELGGKCVQCGSTKQLEFDHIDPSDKEFTIGSNLTYPREKVREELKKCQLLCRGCHIEKHKSEHGSLGMYSHYKCRCDLCKEAWNKRSREYRRERRKKASVV